MVEIPGMADSGSAYFRNLYDHLIRISDMVDAYRDLIGGAMDTHLSMVSNRLNVIMKQLAMIATIFLPLGFLTGFLARTSPGCRPTSRLASATSSSSASAPRSSRSRSCSWCSSAAAGSAAAPWRDLIKKGKSQIHDYSERTLPSASSDMTLLPGPPE